MDTYNLIHYGFKIVDGVLKPNNGYCASIRVEECQWSGNPCTKYRFNDYSLSEYTIEKSWHDEWYLKRGYQEVCKLKYYCGKNWETY